MKKEKIHIEIKRSVHKEAVLVQDEKSGGYTAYFSDRKDILVEADVKEGVIKLLSETYAVVKSKEMSIAFSKLVQSYLGMNPSDKQCKSWNEMQDKMLGEIADLIDDGFDLNKELIGGTAV